MHSLWKAYLAVVAATLAVTTLLSVSTSTPERRPPIPDRRRPPTHHIVAFSAEKQLALQRRDAVVCNVAPRPPSPGQVHVANVHWQRVAGSPLSVYAAHLDGRTARHKFIRVLAMADDADVAAAVYCQVWYDDDDASYRVVEATVADMWPDRWDADRPANTSDPTMLTCELEDAVNGTSPAAVSIAARDPCGAASTLLPLAVPRDVDPRSDFVVCVKGVVGAGDASLRLVEWLELNVLLGAKQFFVYVYAVHRRVRKVLEFYARKGLVTLVELSLPPGQPGDAADVASFLDAHRWQKRRNELIPYNDCFYRNLRASRFVVPLDLDEVIVPVGVDTWTEMFAALVTAQPDLLRQYASFTARNAFFFDAFPTTPTSAHDGGGGGGGGLHMLSHRTRSVAFGRDEQHGKSFIATASALVVFNHYALQTLTTATSRLMVLDTAVAQLNHYRGDCDEVFMDRCEEFRKNAVRDDIVLKYMKMLKYNVRQRLRQLFFNSSSHIY